MCMVHSVEKIVAKNCYVAFFLKDLSQGFK